MSRRLGSLDNATYTSRSVPPLHFFHMVPGPAGAKQSGCPDSWNHDCCCDWLTPPVAAEVRQDCPPDCRAQPDVVFSGDLTRASAATFPGDGVPPLLTLPLLRNRTSLAGALSSRAFCDTEEQID